MIFRACLFVFCALWLCGGLMAQPPVSHPCSTVADTGHGPCLDTLHILSFRRGYDIGVILPSWQVVRDPDYVAVAEGRVDYNPVTGIHGPHVSHDDLPFYHYTHDMCVEIIPDPTPDGRYTNLLPYLVTTRPDGKTDTTLQSTLGIEWECGLGAGNRLNPCAKLNNAGKSCGLCSSGHEPGDMIRIWPTDGDWMHVEGLYVWDRGHPPANCEIHPARLMAIKRALPDKIKTPDGSEKFATRMDIYASGDGGGVNNNRPDAKPYVKPVRMSSKDYQFSYGVNLTRPSPASQLKVMVQKDKGDTYPGDEAVTIRTGETVSVSIPWRSSGVSDRAVYARTIYVYWDEGTGAAVSDSIEEYKVDLTRLYMKKLSELWGKAQIRLFVNVGSDWIFLNDFFGRGGKILTRGLGQTFRKRWPLSNQFTLYVPRRNKFRVFISGWEADGADYLMGELTDPAAPCNIKTKRYFKRKLFSVWNMLFRGCEDDEMGETGSLHGHAGLDGHTEFTISPQEGESHDPCPFSKYPLKDRYFLSYTVHKE